MGVGHVAVALGASKAVPRLNVGWLVFGAFLADFLLGIFAALRLEHASAPPDYASHHYLLFTFPYSHGLLPMLIWAAMFGLLISMLQRNDRSRILWVVAAVVLSHFFLDALVHVAGLPLAGESSPKIGLGLWKHLPLELSIETAMTIVGLAVYLKVAGTTASRIDRYGMIIFMALLTVLTWTQLFTTTPPQPAQLIPSWIILPVVLAAILYALDRKRMVTVALNCVGRNR